MAKWRGGGEGGEGISHWVIKEMVIGSLKKVIGLLRKWSLCHLYNRKIFTFDISGIKPGVYQYQLVTKNQSFTNGKLVIIR